MGMTQTRQQQWPDFGSVISLSAASALVLYTSAGQTDLPIMQMACRGIGLCRCGLLCYHKCSSECSSGLEMLLSIGLLLR